MLSQGNCSLKNDKIPSIAIDVQIARNAAATFPDVPFLVALSAFVVGGSDDGLDADDDLVIFYYHFILEQMLSLLERFLLMI